MLKFIEKLYAWRVTVIILVVVTLIAATAAIGKLNANNNDIDTNNGNQVTNNNNVTIETATKAGQDLILLNLQQLHEGQKEIRKDQNTLEEGVNADLKRLESKIDKLLNSN
jgi:hypothetical protein